jgi:hypothetical protein
MISTILGRQSVVSRFLLRVGLMGLVMILLLGSVGQARSAGNYQSQRDDFSLTVWAFKLLKQNYLCTGEQMRIDVQTLYLTPVGQNKIPTPTAGLPVSAKVTGGTGTVSPQSTRTVWGPDSDSPPRTAVFNFKATKAGHEKIIFETIAPTEFGEFLPSESIPATLEFDVKNCKKKASLIYRSQQFAWSVNRTGWWMEYGNMEEVLLEPNEQGNFEVVGLYQFGGYLTNMAECPWNFAGSDLQVDIAGNLGEDVVNLALDFGWPEVTVSFCSGSYTSPPAALLGQQSAAIPAAGGVTNIIVPVPYGAPSPSGTAVITVIVQPEAEQAVSRKDHPVAWLPGWFEAALFLPGGSR